MTDRLIPPNRAALWASLALTETQVATLCGLSQRRIKRWAQRGYLPRSPRAPGRYSGAAVDMALLIKQGLGAGLLLGQSVEQARAYLAAERTRQPDLHTLDPAALAMVATRIAQANAAARQVLDVVAPLAPQREASP